MRGLFSSRALRAREPTRDERSAALESTTDQKRDEGEGRAELKGAAEELDGIHGVDLYVVESSEKMVV